jgi:hypothetical protein
MTLIIEDGTIVAGAESYASASDLAAYALKYGYTVPATTVEQEQLLMKAMLTVESKAYQGYRTDSIQSLSFPRTGVYVDDILLDSDSIPSQLSDGQMAMAVDGYTTDFLPVTDPTTKGSITHEEVVGAVVRKYAANSSSSKDTILPTSSKAETLLKPLTKSNRGWIVRA